MKKVVLLSLTALAMGCATSKPTEPSPQTQAAAAPAPITTLEEAVANPYRTAANKERDIYRHPLATLQFFGLKPDMKVIEISPGNGWYMEILAPYLHDKGQYIAAVGAPMNETGAGEQNQMNATISNWMKEHPQASDKIQFVTFAPDTHAELGMDNSADAIVTFRNFHNWMSKGAEKKALKAFFKALKPGGILGLVEHRASTKTKQDPKAKSGYVRQDYVINLAKKAGFKLVEASEINANPKDTKDYPNGVWTLPPTYKLGEQDHAKYKEIGESDRMTLKFIKPVKK